MKNNAIKSFKRRQIVTAVCAAAYALLPDFLPGPVDDAIVGVIAAVLELIWAVKAWNAEKQKKSNNNYQ